MPSGTSISPVFATFPVTANVFVPGEPGVPIFRYSSAPISMMSGIVANVSTLLMTVGLCQSPDCAGKGGLGAGIPLLPSMDAMSAVSSPQTNAPAPSITVIFIDFPVFNASGPSIPIFSASLTAFFILFTASGYSILT